MSSILSLELIFALVMYGAGIITGIWVNSKFKNPFKQSKNENS